MRSCALALALVAMVGIGFAPEAKALITLDISSVPGADITFTGGGSGVGASFQFTNSSISPYTGFSFNVTGEQGGTNSALGLMGTLGGTYSYTDGSIVTSGGTQTAPLTTTPSGGGLLSINDGAGFNFTGNVTGETIQTSGTGGTINVTGTINLTGVSYGGSNADLVTLKNETVGGGIAALTFQFINPQQTLTTLEVGTNSTSYSGSIAGVPEPSSMALAGLGALGLIGYGLRRRKAIGA